MHTSCGQNTFLLNKKCLLVIKRKVSEMGYAISVKNLSVMSCTAHIQTSLTVFLKPNLTTIKNLPHIYLTKEDQHTLFTTVQFPKNNEA